MASLSELRPLRIEVVGPKQSDYRLYQRYLARHHHLSYRGPVGESLADLIRSGTGVELACLLFGAAAWQCAPRDQWMGWLAPQRAETFIERDRFRGACYQAANWVHVGRTTGRTRQSRRHRDHEVHAPVKDIYLYPLTADGPHPSVDNGVASRVRVP